MALHFSFAEFEREISALNDLAHPYLSRQAQQWTLPQWKESLRQIRFGGVQKEWEISKERPLKTDVSKGAYQPDDKGALNVFAAISSKWSIKPVPKGLFELSGNASTIVQIFLQDNPDVPIAQWHFDIADINGPGAFTHSQIDWSFGPAGNMDIPRFPSLVVTPMDAIDFAIGELFLERWNEHTASSQFATHVRALQKRRFLNLFDWKRKIVDETLRSTPWVSIRRKRPPDNLFIK